MQTLCPLSTLVEQTHGSASLWMEQPTPDFPPLNEDLTADVCIIGGGISGLSCAYFLLQQGLSVVILEGSSLIGGQSARTTGHLAWSLDDRFHELERLFGLDGARIAAESHREAISNIEKIIQEENIACDFEKLNAYLFLTPGDSIEILNNEYETLEKIGMPIQKLVKAPIQSFDTGPCLEFPDHGQFHILKYMNGLIEAIVRKRGRIFCHTHVHRVQDGSPCYVVTDHHVVTAKSIIVATNTPINDRFMIHTKQASYRTYVVAGAIPKNSVPKGLYYDTLEPYHYVRIQKHETEPYRDWLIIGGEDHKTGQEEVIFEKYLQLEHWAFMHFPQLSEISYRWSGQIIEPIDGLAFIGHNPHEKNVYIATGDSGHGITHGTIAGLILTDLIVKGSHPWAELYHPSRKTLHAVRKYAKENINVAAQYSDWLLPGEVDSLDKIPPGRGAVVREGLKKIAVYKDLQGKLHCYSAICPHLGCIVRWNSGEKSWDCPCHGSRFDTNGQVLNGPATHPLTPL